MKPLASLTRAWLIAAATCVLAACGGGDGGGGGDTPSQPATNEYLGEWLRVGLEGCIPSGEELPGTGNQMYLRGPWKITQAGGNDLRVRKDVWFYEDARCTRPLFWLQEDGDLRYVGQRVRYLGRGDGTVDRYIYQWTGSTVRAVTGESEQLTAPLGWQSGQDVSLRLESGLLHFYYDAIPDGYGDVRRR